VQRAFTATAPDQLWVAQETASSRMTPRLNDGTTHTVTLWNAPPPLVAPHGSIETVTHRGIHTHLHVRADLRRHRGSRDYRGRGRLERRNPCDTCGEPSHATHAQSANRPCRCEALSRSELRLPSQLFRIG
jgi:hypothetical protein